MPAFHRSPAAVRLVLLALCAASAATPVAPAQSAAPATPTPAVPLIGPVVGHVGDQDAWIWLRPSTPGTYTLEVLDDRCRLVRRAPGTATDAADQTLRWHLTGLQPDTLYRYRIVAGDRVIAEHDNQTFSTAPAPGDPARVILGFGSCASSDDFAEIWRRIIVEGVEGMVLLGDTPYIDTNDRNVNRQRHRAWWSYAPIAQAARQIPFWSTWDDHDFGGNDTDGNMPNKDVIRDVFIEYRPLASFGDGEAGIYTHFRRGPIEVFLLDARYFAQTERSFADLSKPTGIGRTQWAWLQERLRASTAPFKILATGMIWDDKTNSEKDDWHTYAHEREAILDFVAAAQIPGVILMGGDIHVSRALRYSEDRVGYPLWQFITSPMHDRTIPSLNPPNPALVFGEPEPNTFLKLTGDSTAEPATLTAEWVKMDGERLYTVQLDAAELTP